MRVLHVDTAMHWGAGQNQVLLLMRELRDGKVEQLCVTPEGSQLAARLRTDSLPEYGVSGSRGRGLRFTRATVRLARGADLVHCHEAGALPSARWAARLRQCRLVAACRVLYPQSPAGWRAADRVVAVSDAVRHSLLAIGVAPDRTVVIHSGIDALELRQLAKLVPPLRDRLGIPPDQFLAGAIGSLHAFRNQRLLPQAAARARDIAWVVVGDGPERGVIEAAIAAHGVEQNVRLVDYLMDRRQALFELDVLVSPATGEALGAGILEAMALDVPVLAADDGGPAEILRPVHAETGVSLFAPGDPDGLAAMIRRVRAEPGLRDRMIAAQRKRVADFSSRKMARATAALYRELVKGAR